MEEAVQVLFGLIAVGLLVTGVVSMLNVSRENSKARINDQAIAILNDECIKSCEEKGVNSKIGFIKVASGSVIFTRNNKVCYEFGEDRMRCQVCPCNVTVKTILNISNESFVKAAESFNYKCQVTKLQNMTTLRMNISINCTI